MQRTFSTPDPVALYVELGSRRPHRPHRRRPTETDVEVDGQDAEDVGSSSAATRSGWSPSRAAAACSAARRRLTVRVPLPARQPAAAPSSARPTCPSPGRLGDDEPQDRLGRRPARRRSTARRLVETGSGDVARRQAVDRRAAGQDRLRRRRRSTELGGRGQVSTGSGDVSDRRQPPSPVREDRLRRPARSATPSSDVALQHRLRRPGRRPGAPRPARRQERLRRHPGRRPGRRAGVDRHHHRHRQGPLGPPGRRRAHRGPGLRRAAARTVSGAVHLEQL